MSKKGRRRISSNIAIPLLKPEVLSAARRVADGSLDDPDFQKDAQLVAKAVLWIAPRWAEVDKQFEVLADFYRQNRPGPK